VTTPPSVAALLMALDELDLDALMDLPLEDRLRVHAFIAESYRTLGQFLSVWTNSLAESMPKQVEVEGVGVFVKKGKRDRTQWDKDALLSAVLDSRLVNTETGEVTEESPLDKVRAVWNLGTPRVTALRERNIDPDQFCRSEWGGWGIEVL
jgi:hypothetical protein